MRIIPVIDLLGGQVVRGVGGRRHEYRPIQSVLAADARPQSIARALGQLGFREAYVADLDAIAGAEPAISSYEVIADCGLRLWVDAGLSNLLRAGALAQLTVAGEPLAGIIAGLESLTSWELLADMSKWVGIERLIFSLDLKQHRPLTKVAEWQSLTPADITANAVEIGVRRIIVLDYAQVGVGQGVGTEDLCRTLRSRHRELEIIAGGGVRSAADLESLSAAGCDAALVASALHDGRLLPPADG